MMRRRLSCLFLAAAMAMLAGQAWAQAGYTVEGVEVQATASDATTARMKAMEQGETEAFRRLLQRLLPSEAEAESRANAAAGHQISRMVRGYDVRNERLTATSYAARLDVNFDPAQVNAFLRGPQGQSGAGTPAHTLPGGQPSAQPATQPQPARSVGQHMSNLLVLPIWWQDGRSPLLWEGGNRWREAWNAAERSDTQFIRLPIGDQSDQMMIDGKQAVQAGFSAFSPIAERYQSSTVIVAQARQTVSSGVNALAVTLRTLGRDGQTGEQPLVYEQRSAEEADELMARAAQDIIQRVMYTAQQQAAMQQAQAAAAQRQQEAEAARDQQGYAPRSRLTVLSRVQQLNDWVVLRRRLLSLPMVEQVDMAAISNQQVDLIVHYRGSHQQLEAAMLQQGLVVQKARNYWVVESGR